MNKKQVKAILDLTKNDTREALTWLHVDLYNDKPVLVATDAYTLIALYTDEKLADKVGYGMQRDKLEIWYKLANARSLFTAKDLELEQNSSFPKWQQIIEKTEQQPTSIIGFDSKLANRLEAIAGEQLYYELAGNDNAMIAHNDKGLFVLMPLRPRKEASHE